MKQSPHDSPLHATVYIIEPDGEVRERLRALARLLGCGVEALASAEEFLALPVQPGHRACLVAEVDLPGLSGLELQERLARDRPDLPIIFLCSRGKVPTAVRALRAGAIDFIEKPFIERALLHQIKDLIRGSEPLP